MKKDQLDIETVITKARAFETEAVVSKFRVVEQKQMADWLEELVQLRAEKEELKETVFKLGDTVLAKIFREQGYKEVKERTSVVVKK